MCVGFADLVGFTAQTQQLDSSSLAGVVDRFEAIAYDVVASNGGRVVKTIGDEVMFVADDAVIGCRTALDLARRYREDEALSDVRVGMAFGPVLERDGDVYGHTVNLASRIVNVAYPGSVVVSTELHDAVSDDPELRFTSLRSHYLKDIGRLPLWRLRFASDPVEDPYPEARRARALQQRDMRSAGAQAGRDELRERSAGLIAELMAGIDELPGRLPLVLSGNAPPEVVQALVEEPTSGEIEALSEAVLEAELDPDVRLDLLTDLGASERLRELRAEVDQKAAQADDDAEEQLRRIEDEARRAIDVIEREHRDRVAAVIARATDASKRVDEQATRRVEKAVQDAERKADQATRDARAKARRAATQRARMRGRT